MIKSTTKKESKTEASDKKEILDKKILDKKDLEQLKQELDSFENQRELSIHQSREIIRLSKKVIYAVHRNDMSSASESAALMKAGMKKLYAGTSDAKLLVSGSFKVAVQEYVEAFCFYELMKNNRIPPNSELKLDAEFYLLGLTDLTGELVRKAINSAIKGNYKTALKLKDLVSDLYDELMLFDFAGGELRKKFDSIKYDLKKLDDLALSLKLSNKD
jgi:predicted translin family RNA/ssDNA-binding protein